MVLNLLLDPKTTSLWRVDSNPLLDVPTVDSVTVGATQLNLKIQNQLWDVYRSILVHTFGHFRGRISRIFGHFTGYIKMHHIEQLICELTILVQASSTT